MLRISWIEFPSGAPKRTSNALSAGVVWTFLDNREWRIWFSVLRKAIWRSRMDCVIWTRKTRIGFWRVLDIGKGEEDGQTGGFRIQKSAPRKKTIFRGGNAVEQHFCTPLKSVLSRTMEFACCEQVERWIFKTKKRRRDAEKFAFRKWAPIEKVRTGFSFASYMGLKDSNVEYRRPPSERKFEIQKDLP